MGTKEFLSFVLAEEEYAVDILDVREVRGWSDVRPIPNSPEFLLGVLELRGEYVPIVDLRSRFGMEPAVLNATTVVIVLNDANGKPLGIIVDAVSEVYPLSEEQIKPAPSLSVSIDHRYIVGITAVENGHVVLINLEALFDIGELNQLSETA
ncbi:chemotaxis protein CheW [Thaumasiovibrio subtropicus]|uniref:chemotaxis protein CheW n=1 Tax=Thaumasiovibrio subtropicus TaxID=1891207 RepID=UPI000B351344|nr:chemotaxis protein CheW [Thaumasiovibrio subtropicus]